VMKTRYLSENEKLLVSALIDAGEPKWSHLKSELASILVSEMKDEGMGSLKFEIKNEGNRQLGGSICEAEFDDHDGVTVSVVLNVDQQNRLYELDVWKVDFRKLISFPEIDQLKFMK